MIVNKYIWRKIIVKGHSMEPSISEGDQLMMTSLGHIGVGDVVVIKDRDRLYIKRIALISGKCPDGRIVPSKYTYVMGDNKENSRDSRSRTFFENGFVPQSAIIGRAVFRIFPLSKAGIINRRINQ